MGKKRFDYIGAVNEGYSNEEIQQYLNDKGIKFDLVGAVNEGYEPQEIDDYLNTEPQVKKKETPKAEGSAFLGTTTQSLPQNTKTVQSNGTSQGKSIISNPLSSGFELGEFAPKKIAKPKKEDIEIISNKVTDFIIPKSSEESRIAFKNKVFDEIEQGKHEDLVNFYTQKKDEADYIKTVSLNELIDKSKVKIDAVKGSKNDEAVYLQSKEGKIASFANDILNGDELAVEDLNYLKENAPQVTKDLLGITKQFNEDFPIENLNTIAQQRKAEIKQYQQQKGYENITNDVNVVSSFTPKDMLGTGKIMDNLVEIDKLRKAEIEQLSKQYPLVPKTYNDGRGTVTVSSRDKKYDEEVAKINDKYTQVLYQSANAEAYAYALRNKPTITALEAGEKYLQIARPTDYLVYINSGKKSEQFKQDATEVGMNLLQASGDKDLIVKGQIAEENFDAQFPSKAEEKIRRKLKIEALKEQGGANWVYDPIGLPVSVADRLALSQLSEKERKIYFDRIRPNDQRKAVENGDYLGLVGHSTMESSLSKNFKIETPNSGGWANKFLEGVTMPIGGTIKTVANLFESKEAKAKRALDEKPNLWEQSVIDRNQIVDRLKEIRATKNISIEQAKEIVDLESQLELKSKSQVNTDEMWGLAGQVAGQGVLTIAGAPLIGKIGNLVQVGAKSVTLGSNIAKVAKYTSELKNQSQIAGALSAFTSTYDDATLEAERLMPKGTLLEKKLYATGVATLNAITERIFKDEKIFDAFKKEIAPSMSVLVRELSSGKITETVFRDNLKNIVTKSLPKYATSIAINNQQESIEEVATSLGTSMLKGLGVLSGAIDQKDFNIDEEIEAVKQTYQQTALSSVGVSFFGGISDVRRNRLNKKVVYDLGVSKAKTDEFINVIRAQVAQGTMSEAESIEKIKTANTLSEIATQTIPLIEKKKKLTPQEKVELTNLMLAERELRSEIANPNLVDTKKLSEKQLSEIEKKKDAILNDEVIVDNDYQVYTPEEYNAKLEAEKTPQGVGVIETKNPQGESMFTVQNPNGEKEIFFTRDEADARVVEINNPKIENNATQNTEIASAESTTTIGQNELPQTEGTVNENVTETQKPISAKLEGKPITIEKTENGYTYTTPKGRVLEVTEAEHQENIADNSLIIPKIEAGVSSTDAIEVPTTTDTPTAETATKSVVDLVDKKVEFKGQTGTITQDEGGKLTFVNDDEKGFDYDLTKEDVAKEIIVPEPPTIKVEGNNVSIGDETFEFVSNNLDNNGNVVSVTLKDKEGRTITKRDADLALEIGIQKNNQLFDSRTEITPQEESENTVEINNAVTEELQDELGGMAVSLLENIPEVVDNTLTSFRNGIVAIAPDELQVMIAETSQWIDNTKEQARKIKAPKKEKQQVILALDNLQKQLNKYYEKVEKQRLAQNANADKAKATESNGKSEQKTEKGKSTTPTPTASVEPTLTKRQIENREKSRINDVVESTEGGDIKGSNISVGDKDLVEHLVDSGLQGREAYIVKEMVERLIKPLQKITDKIDPQEFNFFTENIEDINSVMEGLEDARNILFLRNKNIVDSVNKEAKRLLDYYSDKNNLPDNKLDNEKTFATKVDLLNKFLNGDVNYLDLSKFGVDKKAKDYYKPKSEYTLSKATPPTTTPTAAVEPTTPKKLSFSEVPIFIFSREEGKKAEGQVVEVLTNLGLGQVLSNSDGEIKIVTEKSTDKKGNTLIGITTFEREEDGSLRQTSDTIFAKKNADGKSSSDYNPHTTARDNSGKQITVTDEITDDFIDLSKENVMVTDKDGNLVKTEAFSNFKIADKSTPTTTPIAETPTESKIEKLEKEYNSQSVDDLVTLKKKLYPNPDIESAMSEEEKLLDKVIAKKFSDINQQIIQKRKNKQNETTRIADNNAENELAVAKLTEQDNPIAEPIIEVIEGEAESNDKAKLNEVIAKVDELVNNATDVVNVPISEIKINEKEYQGRKKAFSERSANKVHKFFSRDKFNPIIIYKHPDGNTYVLSGHSRLEGMKRRGESTIPARYFEGNEQYPNTPEGAKKFAMDSNKDATLQTDLENSDYYRGKLKSGSSYNAVLVEAKENEQEGSAVRIIDYAHLNPKGKAYQALEALEKGESDTSTNVKLIAQKVGRIRSQNEHLTDAHEQELFDYFSENGYPTDKEIQDPNGTINRSINAVRFDPKEPLNLNKFVAKTAERIEWEKELKELETLRDELKKEVNPSKQSGWSGLKEKVIASLAKGKSKEQIDQAEKDFNSNKDNVKTNYEKKLAEQKQKLQGVNDKIAKHLLREKSLIQGEKNQGSLFSTSKPKKSITKEAFTALTDMLKKAFPKVKFIDEARAKEILDKFGFDNVSKMFISNKNANLFSESFNGKTIGENFNFANELEAQGKSSDEIKFATGWFKAGDGRWRYEITDKDAKLKVELPTNGKEVTAKLKHILDHPKLFELYPQLANSEITITHDNTKSNHGQHYKLGDKHYIVANTTGDINKTISEILHEVQHAVQSESGLSLGANNNVILNRKIELFKSKLGRSPNADETRTLALEANREYKSAYGEIEAKATQDNAKQSEQQRIFDSTIEKTIKKYGIDKNDITFRTNNIQYLQTNEGQIYGFQFSDEIFIDPSLMNADTPIHEVVGHYGINIIDAQSRGGDAKATAVMLKGFALLKEPEGKAVLDEVQANPAYANLPLRKQKLEALATIIGREGASIFEEGTKGANKSTPNIFKVKSFKTDEGKFDIYDTEKDGARGRVDMFTILKDKNGWIVRNAFVPDNLQKQGIATDFYKMMNEESIKATGKPLRSTQQRTLNNGEKVHELTANAIKLWDSLVRDGYAEKIGEKNYKFSKEQSTKPSKTFQQKVKAFVSSFYEYLKSKIPTLKDKSIEDIQRMDNKEFIRAIIGDAFRGEIVADNEAKNTDKVMLSATKEAENIALTYNDKGQHLAPNGKPSNLTEQQAKIVRTDAFKNWFGDWVNDPKNASKVLDENGEPLVVYHGSPSGDITQFDINKSKTESSGLKEFGSWFTTNKKVAELYANKRLTDGVSGNAIYPVFLNLRNLPEFDAEGKEWYDARRNIKADVGYKTATGIDAIEALAGKNSAKPDARVDGIKLENVIEGDNIGSIYEGTSYLVFDDTPNQIKLADGTNTTFNPNTNDIRFSLESNASSPISDANKNYLDGVLKDVNDGKITIEEAIKDLQDDLPKKYADKYIKYLNDNYTPKQEPKTESQEPINKKPKKVREHIKLLMGNMDFASGTKEEKLLNKLKQDTATTSTEVEGENVSGDYTPAELTIMQQQSEQDVKALKESIEKENYGEDWVDTLLNALEENENLPLQGKESYKLNPIKVIGITNNIAGILSQKRQQPLSEQESLKLAEQRVRLHNYINQVAREASLTLNARRNFRNIFNLAKTVDIERQILESVLSEDTIKEIERINEEINKPITEKELNKADNTKTKSEPTERKTTNKKSNKVNETLRTILKNAKLPDNFKEQMEQLKPKCK